MDIHAMRERAAESGHNPWEETVTAFDDHEQQITALSEQVDTLNVKVADLETERAGLSRQVDDLLGRVEELERRPVPASGA